MVQEPFFSGYVHNFDFLIKEMRRCKMPLCISTTNRKTDPPKALLETIHLRLNILEKTHSKLIRIYHIHFKTTDITHNGPDIIQLVPQEIETKICVRLRIKNFSPQYQHSLKMSGSIHSSITMKTSQHKAYYTNLLKKAYTVLLNLMLKYNFDLT